MKHTDVAPVSLTNGHTTRTKQLGKEKTNLLDLNERLETLAVENGRLKLLLEQSQSRERAALETATAFEKMADEAVAATQYAPKIEASRTDYEKLADALCHMAVLASERTGYALDLRPNDAFEDDNSHPLSNAKDKHLLDLFNNLDWTEPRTIQKFYVEMRLWVDQQHYEWERKRTLIQDAPKPQAVTEQTGKQRYDSLIANALKEADGSLYKAAAAHIDKDRDRFVAAAHSRLSEEENEQAWREFSTLTARALKSGRLWAPEYLWLLAPVFSLVVAEQDELDRVEKAFNAIGDDDSLAEEIPSDHIGIPSLATVDQLVAAVGQPPDEGRRLAGYLSVDCQPLSPLVDEIRARIKTERHAASHSA